MSADVGDHPQRLHGWIDFAGAQAGHDPGIAAADDDQPGGHDPARSGTSSSTRTRTRRAISSRIGRTASTPSPAGSSRFQSSYRLPGKMGQASPQPIVMTTSLVWAVAYSSFC